MQKNNKPTPPKKPTTPKKAVGKTVKAAKIVTASEKPIAPKRTTFNKELKATPVSTVKAPAKPTRKPAVKKPTPKTPTKKPTTRKTPVKSAEVEVKKVDGRIGNQFWMNRAKHGRDKLFATPELLWNAACEYFQYIQDNPLPETRVFQFQGKVITEEVPIMRAMVMRELCFYLNCNEAYFRQFKAQLPEGEKDFSTVIEDIETIVYTQKFQGAAGNLLNANIISRDLGLTDKKDVSSNGETLSFTNFLIQSSEED